MRLRPGATVKVGGRENPYEGKVINAGYGEDGRWYSEVEVKLEDGSTSYRYPDPADVSIPRDGRLRLHRLDRDHVRRRRPPLPAPDDGRGRP